MIELVSAERCTGCNICVAACPTNVFDPVAGGAPVIARQADCQTCFMCELYCPQDALYVAPHVDRVAAVDETELSASEWLGSYRKAVGWGQGRTSTAALDHSHHLLRGG
jgi:NAD-dependent dihydropyrimidine dehydrogenase PreA subunit